jgi:phenylacetate-CoA ligase
MTGLPRYLILDPNAATMPKPALRERQATRLRAMVRYVYDNTDFWRRKFEAAGLTPDDIRGLDDLRRVPFCTKAELLDDQLRNPPFGSYVGSHPTHWYKMFSTSGSTGRPLWRVFSSGDWDNVLDRLHRSAPFLPGDRVMVLAPVDGLMGPTAAAEGASRRGAMVIHAGRFDTRTKVDLIQQFRPTYVMGAASYMLHVAEIAREMGVDLAAQGVRFLTSVGEPGAAIPTTRDRLARRWGATIGDGFGLTEIFPLGGSCPHSVALHIPDDLVITEIVDPDSGKSLPPGKPGELVFTNLISDTQPLLRYRTRDIARTADDTPCACGFTGTLLVNSIEGRVDDMIWYKGINLFPSAIESVLRGFDDAGDEFQIVMRGSDASPVLVIRVEPRSSTSTQGDWPKRLQAAIKAKLKVRAVVELASRGSLPKADAGIKARRFVDERNTSR